VPRTSVICYDGLACGQPVRNLHDGSLGVAVQQQIALGIDDDGTPHLVGPVVVVGDTPQ